MRLERSNDPAPTFGPPPNPEAEQWSRVEHLLAAVRDELHYMRHAYSQAHSRQRLKWRPEQLPRPGISSRKPKRAAITAEQTALLERHLHAVQG